MQAGLFNATNIFFHQTLKQGHSHQVSLATECLSNLWLKAEGPAEGERYPNCPHVCPPLELGLESGCTLHCCCRVAMSCPNAPGTYPPQSRTLASLESCWTMHHTYMPASWNQSSGRQHICVGVSLGDANSQHEVGRGSSVMDEGTWCNDISRHKRRLSSKAI